MGLMLMPAHDLHTGARASNGTYLLLGGPGFWDCIPSHWDGRSLHSFLHISCHDCRPELEQEYNGTVILAQFQQLAMRLL